MTSRIDSTNCTHDAALARIAELESKLQASVKAHNEIFEALRASEEKLNAQSLRLDKLSGELRGASEEIEYQAKLRKEVERRLGAAIEKLTELSWQDYDEQHGAAIRAVCDSLVERHEHKYGDDGWCVCGDHALGVGPSIESADEEGRLACVKCGKMVKPSWEPRGLRRVICAACIEKMTGVRI